jgi:hypothetical protein
MMGCRLESPDASPLELRVWREQTGIESKSRNGRSRSGSPLQIRPSAAPHNDAGTVTSY